MKIDCVKQISRQAFGELIKTVEAGRSEQLEQYLKAMGRFHKYSAMNSMLIGFQRPDAKHVAGFHAWKKLGRSVMKGEKRIAIMAPIVCHKDIPLLQEEEEDPEEIVLAFKPAYVFDVSQTEGRQFPEFAAVQGDPKEFLERLKEYLYKQKILLEYRDDLGLTKGISRGGQIILKAFQPPAEEFSTLVHELAHEIMHKDWTNILPDKKVQEIQAEAVAFVVCHGIGLDVNTASSDYIQLYNGDKNILMQLLQKIQGTASEILREITKPLLEVTAKAA